MKTSKNIAYGRHRMQRLDAYIPDDPNGATVILTHGGGWWQGDKAKDGPLAQRLAGEGYQVFAVNYRLADGKENLFPCQRSDLFAATEWLLGSDYGIDRTRTAFFGASSGGNLSVEASLHYGFPCVSWSGLLALDDFMVAHPNVVPKQLHIDPNVPSNKIDQKGANDAYYKWLVLNLLGGDLTHIGDTNPIHRVNSQAGPMLLANSTNELVPCDEIFKLGKALSENGLIVQTMTIPGSKHGEGYEDEALPVALTFLKQHLLG
ncbi:MAG: alpha/beta hydrolase [Propionibacteriaceae bacterium]|jgi:dipeptidyl aminopeptidase/acylaminoacyl peptidase|nr:alpha/beta hydrolase [Propionibacteriaceae bacterium]